MSRDTEWQDKSDRAGEGTREERSSLCVLGAAIYSHYVALTAFRCHPALECIVADWALSNSHLLMPHQQAWQHVIDMLMQMDVTAFLSAAAYAADINAHKVMKYWLDRTQSTVTFLSLLQMHIDTFFLKWWAHKESTFARCMTVH